MMQDSYGVCVQEFNAVVGAKTLNWNESYNKSFYVLEAALRRLRARALFQAKPKSKVVWGSSIRSGLMEKYKNK